MDGPGAGARIAQPSLGAGDARERLARVVHGAKPRDQRARVPQPRVADGLVGGWSVGRTRGGVERGRERGREMGAEGVDG